MSNQPSQSQQKGHLRKYWKFYFALLVGLSAVGYIWYIGNSKIQALRIENQKSIDKIKSTADSLILANSKQSRELLAKSLGWSFSPLAKSNNKTRIVQHIDQLVKYKGIKAVSMVSKEDIITYSSNASFIGKQFKEIYNYDIEFAINETESYIGNDEMIVVQPLLDSTQIMGKIIIVFDYQNTKSSINLT